MEHLRAWQRTRRSYQKKWHYQVIISWTSLPVITFGSQFSRSLILSHCQSHVLKCSDMLRSKHINAPSSLVLDFPLHFLCLFILRNRTEADSYDRCSRLASSASVGTSSPRNALDKMAWANFSAISPVDATRLSIVRAILNNSSTRRTISARWLAARTSAAFRPRRYLVRLGILA